MSKRKAPKKGAVKDESKKDSKKKTVKSSSERSLTLNRQHLEAAVEHYLHSLRLIDGNEKVTYVNANEMFDKYFIGLKKEVLN